MKLDDRDIICETDYSPLSGEELVTQIEWHAAAMSGATAYDLERITGPARALLARAEVLEVAFANSHELNETLGNENRTLLARAEAAEASREALADRLVFEMEQRETVAAEAEAAEALAYERLENLLFAEQRANDLETLMLIGVDVPPPDDGRVGEAAQQWRPVTERPKADDEYLVWCSSYEGCEIQSYSSRLNHWYSNAGNDADYWRPLPPAPQETE